MHAHRWAIALACADLVVIATLASAPNVLQPLYWQTGLLTYLPPFILWPLVTAYVLRTGSTANPVVVASVAFIASGFNEPAMAAQCVAATCAAVVRRGRRREITALAAGSIIGAVVMVLSPGNTVRRGHFSEPIAAFAFDSVRVLGQCLGYLLNPVALGAFVVLIAVGRFVSGGRRPALSPIYIIGATVAFAGVAISPGIYGFGAIEPRTAFIPVGILAAGLALAAFIVASRLEINVRPSFVVVSSAAVALVGVITASTPLEPLSRYASAWTSQDALLRSAPRSAIVQLPVLAHNPFGLEDVGVPGSRWATECAVEYYGVRGVEWRERRR